MRIRVARLRAGLSQEALATRVRRTPESISNIERGQQLPALDTLFELVEVLDLPLTELLDTGNDTRKLSRKRLMAEGQIMEMVRGLSDNAIEVAISQLAALRSIK